jgi:hypothetical protein
LVHRWWFFRLVHRCGSGPRAWSRRGACLCLTARVVDFYYGGSEFPEGRVGGLALWFALAVVKFANCKAFRLQGLARTVSLRAHSGSTVFPHSERRCPCFVRRASVSVGLQRRSAREPYPRASQTGYRRQGRVLHVWCLRQLCSEMQRIRKGVAGGRLTSECHLRSAAVFPCLAPVLRCCWGMARCRRHQNLL